MSKGYISASLRRLVCNRANHGCEYCLIPEIAVLVSHEIDHVIAEKHGGKTLILGRFLPIIRTFAPIIAGVIKVPMGTFMVFNILGGALWICSLSFIGYYIGHKFPWIEGYLGYIILGFISIPYIAPFFIISEIKAKT